MSTASPAANPITAPSSGPLASAIATTTTSTRLGGDPPGNGRLLRTVTCSTIAARTPAVASRARRIYPPPAVALGLGVADGLGCGRGGSTENSGLCRGRVTTTPTTPSELSLAYGRT